ncbi:hypothetical protein [Marinobacter sp.]|uniref:hypothetical protein n=1 Tax=Marinobacter sp. TaxID=50741 RepID=UPI003B51D745
MKYDDLPEEEKTKLNAYFEKQATQQSLQGRELFESVSKSVLYANTGGVAVTSSLIATTTMAENGRFFGLAFLSFVVGVALFIIFRFYLAIAVGGSVAQVKQFHREAIEGSADVSGKSINTRMTKISANLDGNAPMWIILLPILTFLCGAALGCMAVVLKFVA